MSGSQVLVHGPVAEAWIQGRDLPFIMISPQMPIFETPRPNPAADIPRRTPTEPPPPRRRGRRPGVPMARDPTSDAGEFSLGRFTNSWNKMQAEVLLMVDSTLEEFRADADRVYLTGLSFGGMGTWHLAIEHPDRWTAIAPICGPGDPTRVGRLADSGTPVWAFQGGRDAVVRPEWVLETVRSLEAAGHDQVRFTVHEDLGHNAWTRVYEGWDLYAWFLSHRRSD